MSRIPRSILVVALVIAWVSASVAGTTQYVYDDLGRLIRVERPDCTITTYTYDAIGNRLSKSVAVDQDCDTVRDTLDCAPADGGAFAPPAEVTGLLFSDKVTLNWNSAAPTSGTDTVHDVARGLLSELPVGTGDSEACVAPGVQESSASASSTPDPGTGYWYLVRGRNVCDIGSYGAATGGAERSTGACP